MIYLKDIIKIEKPDYKNILGFIFFFLFIFNSSFFSLSASIFNNDSFDYKIETRASFSEGANTPFWLVNNIYGLGSPELNNGYVRGNLKLPISASEKLSLGGGLDLVGAWNLPAAFRIQQFYVDFKYRRLFISIGSREYHSEICDSRLSSGDLLLSDNFLPIPQIRIGTFGFAPIGKTNDWLAIKAYLAYGKFTDSNWQKNWISQGSLRTKGVLYNSRGLWFRIGNPEILPLSLDIGGEMATQFGGTIYKEGEIIKMPSGILDWIKAVIPLRGSNATPVDEITNVQGNMNGEYVASISYFHKDWKFRLYYEHYFEDHSQMFFEYGAWKDGLLGLEINFPSNPYVSKFVYEYIATKDQSGPILHNSTPEIPDQVSGQDNYYDHYLYGPWQTWGMTMGSPLAISPLYNKSHNLVMYNTRFLANHIGIEGNPCQGLRWRTLFSFSKNWGTHFRPLPEIMDNFSGLVELEYQPKFLSKFYIKGALAWDTGQLLGNNFGGMISIGYHGNFSIIR